MKIPIIVCLKSKIILASTILLSLLLTSNIWFFTGMRNVYNNNDVNVFSEKNNNRLALVINSDSLNREIFQKMQLSSGKLNFAISPFENNSRDFSVWSFKKQHESVIKITPAIDNYYPLKVEKDDYNEIQNYICDAVQSMSYSIGITIDNVGSLSNNSQGADALLEKIIMTAKTCNKLVLFKGKYDVDNINEKGIPILNSIEIVLTENNTKRTVKNILKNFKRDNNLVAYIDISGIHEEKVPKELDKFIELLKARDISIVTLSDIVLTEK